MKSNFKLIRITTVPLSLDKLLEGQLRFMNNYYQVIAISSDNNYLREIGVREGVEVFHVSLTRRISPIADFKALCKLYLFLKSVKPHIVHSHTPKAGTIGMLAARLANVPHRLHTVAGLPLLETTGNKRRLLNFVEKITYACATKVYPNSFGLKKIILKNGFCEAEKLKVIGDGSSNGINTAVFKLTQSIEENAKLLAAKYKLDDRLFTFIFIGRLVKDKGIEELIQAFSILAFKYSDLRLILVGPEERDLDPLSSKCLLEIERNPSIIPVGYQSDVRPFLALSKALVFPSYREGFPNVPMQAGCFNLPSIVTDINGCNEIIIDNENGLIVPVKNVESLSKAMEDLYLNEEKYQIMSCNARKMIVERYDQKKIWSLILEEYQQLKK
jgi:glycosyltransferase involved in cell wall biosynthesis